MFSGIKTPSPLSVSRGTKRTSSQQAEGKRANSQNTDTGSGRQPVNIGNLSPCTIFIATRLRGVDDNRGEDRADLSGHEAWS